MQENFHLDDQILQSLLRSLFFRHHCYHRRRGPGSRTAAGGSGETRGRRRFCRRQASASRLWRAGVNRAQEFGRSFSLELRHARSQPVIVGIDVDHAIEVVARLRDSIGFQIQIEQPHQRVKIFGFAVQVLVHLGDEFRELVRLGSRGGHSFRLPGKLIFLLRVFHARPRQGDHRYCLIVLSGAQVGQSQIE